MRTPHITLAKLGLLLLILVFGLLFHGPTVHAAGESISWYDLTIANGWVCDAGKTNCTKGSSTASCRTYSGTGQSETQYHECILKTGSGDTGVGITSTGAGGNTFQPVNEKTDGKITQIDKVNAQTQNEIKKEQQSGGSCSATSPSTWGDCILKAVASAVLVFANWLLGVAGVLFNLVMVYGVFQFANIIGNSKGVLTAWGILRDLANMALLFGFIFMGIATILDTGAVQNFTAKRALPSLLIFAILMNFSLFTTEALIDVSNALSASLYTQANTDPCTSQSGTNGITPQNCGITYGIAGHIMQSTGLSGIWAIRDGTPLGAETITLFGLALFATIGAIVFFAAAIMLAIRVIMLTLLMVVSPIGFAGMAIPPLRNLAGDWWQRVIHQAFYAPIMLLLILISLKIADSFTKAGGNNGLGDTTLAAAVTGQDATAMGVFLVFMLVIGFMVASLIVANRFGAAGATAAVGYGKKFVLGSYGFVGGQVGRRTIGASGNWAQKKYNASVASGRLKGLSGTIVDDAILGGLKKTQESRFGSNKSYKEKKEHHEARDKELSKIQRIENLKKYSKEGNVVEFRKLVKQLSDTEIIESDLLKGELTKENKLLADIATNTSPERFDKMMSSDKVSEKAKDMARELRFEGVNAAYTKVEGAAAEYAKDPSKKTAYDDARKEMAKKTNELSDKDFGQFVQSNYSDILSQQEFAGSFSDDNFKDRRKNSNLTPAQQASFDGARNSALNNMDAVAERVPSMNIEDIMKLKSDVLSNRKVLGAMSGRKLALIDPNKIGNDDHVKAIVDYIKMNALTDADKGEDFRAQMKMDPRIAKRWERYHII